MAKSKKVKIRNTSSNLSIPKKSFFDDDKYLIGSSTKIEIFKFFDYFIEHLSYGFMLRERTNNLMR
jgi:hypothetical protein